MSEELTAMDMKNASRAYSRDMSPEAITRRLDTVVELNELCDWLGSGRKIGKADPGRNSEAE
jgi:hypothetical protein